MKKIRLKREFTFPAQLIEEDFNNKLVEWKAKDAPNSLPKSISILQKSFNLLVLQTIFEKILKRTASKRHVGLFHKKDKK